MSKFTKEELKNLKTLTDSVNAKDSIGEGKCAPITIDYVREAKVLKKNADKAIDNPRIANILADDISDMLNKIKVKQQEIRDYDRYWAMHKTELNKNLDEALLILTNLKNKLK